MLAMGMLGSFQLFLGVILVAMLYSPWIVGLIFVPMVLGFTLAGFASLVLVGRVIFHLKLGQGSHA
jgi:hypothetical protein